MFEKILLTGFSHYGPYYINPSMEIALKLNGVLFNGYKVYGSVLPVSLYRGIMLLQDKLESLNPDIVIGLGLAPRARSITIELASANIAHFPDYKDVDGSSAWMKFIDNNELNVLKTKLSIQKIMNTCCREKVYEITVSLSIGTYLCNIIGYLITKYVWDNNKIGGFIHLPPHTDLALKLGLNNFIPINYKVDAIKCIISVITSKSK